MQGSRASDSGTVLRHIQLAATTAVVVGVADGVWTATQAHQSIAYGALLGAGILVLGGMLVGLVQGLGARVVGFLGHRLGLAAGPARTVAEQERARHRRVLNHARITTLVTCGAMLVGGLSLLLLGSERIKEMALRYDVLLMAMGGALAALMLATVVLQPLLVKLYGAIEKRWGLPRPRSALLRYVLFVAVPVGLLLVPMFMRYGIKLGVLATPFGLLLFFALEGLLWRLRKALPDRWLARGSRSHLVAVLLLLTLHVAAAVGGVVVFERWDKAGVIASQGLVTPSVVETLQNLTDVDRDGISSLYGGNDCAPLDAKRFPQARDIPNNGVDEDCDGADATKSTGLAELVPFSGKLLPAQKKKYNVLLLVIDSLRADHLGAYGYKKKPSPHLDELAKESWVFERAYSQSSTTALSMPSMLSGRRPSSMRWQQGYPKTAASERMLPTLLRKNGYDTFLAINRYVQRHLKSLQAPFQYVRSVPKGVDWRSGEYIISNVISGVEQAKRARRPFFITAHFDDVHHPYTAHRGRSVPKFPHTNKNLAAYDRCIANLDNMLRPLMSHLRATGVWKNTIVIITSDHGEEFKEHGKTIHSQACYVESVHVPLIVRIPGFKPKRIPQRVALTDLVPTLLEAIDVPHGDFPFDGQSLFVPALAPQLVSAKRPIFCSIFQLLGGRKNFFTRSVRTDRHALVYEALSDRTELFDAVADPADKRNIAGANAKTVGAMMDLLKASATGNLWEARRFK